jgi:hypothetical protein
MRNKKTKSRNKKKPISQSKLRSIHRIMLKAMVALLSILLFVFIIHKSYEYALNPVNFHEIPLIKRANKPIKKKFTKNDGLIFLNQDKLIYNSIGSDNKNKPHKKLEHTEKVLQDFSHQQIYNIVQGIKNSHEKDADAKALGQKKVISNPKRDHKKKSIFNVIN